ncbi:MAG: GNAT family N-acetyltransferase [Muriicola sp.]|nr:GNAT family N-acetyltransferase [Muriicola sp.]
MRIVSVREQPEFEHRAITYFQNSWKSVLPVIYEDCISHSIHAKNSLPQWYLLEKEGELIGCAGLITNDFISRGDLYPWVCALFIEEKHRGNAYGSLLLEKAGKDAKKAGFENVYLCTEHIGYYEKYGFTYIGQGYHPWGEESRIYELAIE